MVAKKGYGWLRREMGGLAGRWVAKSEEDWLLSWRDMGG